MDIWMYGRLRGNEMAFVASNGTNIHINKFKQSTAKAAALTVPTTNKWMIVGIKSVWYRD